MPPSDFRTTKRDANPPVTEHSPVDIDVRIESREPCTVACVRHVGPYSDVGQAWQKMMKWGWSKIAFGKADSFGLCYDDPDITEDQRVRYDACIVVAEGARVKDGIELQSLEGSDYVVARHDGPYATIGETYARLFARVVTAPIDGLQWNLGDPPSLEVYLNDPRKTKPEDLKTEIWMPVLERLR
jgi:AraC family transcriptional regulator